VHRKSRLFHLITSLETAVSALSFYAMATGSGIIYLPNGVEHTPTGVVIILREIFYVRFMEHFFSGPVVVLYLTLLAGLSWIDTLAVLIIADILILCACMGALTSSPYVFSCTHYVVCGA
jgi:bacteriorhodopsin